MSLPDQPLNENEPVSVIDTLRRRIDPRRSIGQWIAHGISVAAVLTQASWLLLAGAIVFLLQMLGGALQRKFYLPNFMSMPRLSPDDVPATLPDMGLVTIIAPARNEEGEIERAVRSLDAQDYDPLDVIVINDHSTDSTGAILRRVEPDLSRVRIFHDPPRVEGWIGKPNALRFALEHVRPETQWLLFVDGDVVLQPSALRAALDRAIQRKADFLTCQPRLETGSIVEKLVLPSTWRGIVSNVSYERLNDSESPPMGIGAFMLVRRDMYGRCGGHGRYPHLHADDSLLAGSVRAAGGYMDVAIAPNLMSIRLYRGARQVFFTNVIKARTYSGDRVAYPLQMLSANVLPAALPLPLALVAIVTQLGSEALNPWIMVYIAAALLVYADKSIAHRGIEVVSDVPAWTGWLHPLAAWIRVAIYVTAAIQSVFGMRRYWRGREEVEAQGML